MTATERQPVGSGRPARHESNALRAKLSSTSSSNRFPCAGSAQQALLTVSDKRGVVEFARALHGLGIEILSTGGTAARSRTRASRSPTSAVHGLPGNARRTREDAAPEDARGHPGAARFPEHVRRCAEHGSAPSTSSWSISIRSSETVAKSGCTLEEAIENIDIGGPSMVRAAAKNYARVAVVVDPDDYPALSTELRADRRTVVATALPPCARRPSRTPRRTTARSRTA